MVVGGHRFRSAVRRGELSVVLSKRAVTRADPIMYLAMLASSFVLRLLRCELCPPLVRALSFVERKDARDNAAG